MPTSAMIAETRPTKGGAASAGWAYWAPLIPVLVIGVLAAIAVPGFSTAPNLIAVVQASAITGIAAIGTAAITIAGRFVSLAVEQQAMTAGFAFAAVLLAGMPPAVALLAVFSLATLLGFAQGYLISRGLNPIVTTLAFGSVLFGVVVYLVDNRTLTLVNNPLAEFGGGLTFGIPNQALIFLLVLAVGSWFISRTTLGRQIVLTGANTKAADLIGIPTRKVIITAFIIASQMAALVGVLVVCQVSQAKSDIFDGLTINVVAAILVGGISIQGGEGQIWRAGLGAIILTMLGNIMLLLGIDAGMRELSKGILAGGVLLAITLLKGRGR